MCKHFIHKGWNEYFISLWMKDEKKSKRTNEWIKNNGTMDEKKRKKMKMCTKGLCVCGKNCIANEFQNGNKWIKCIKHIAFISG